MKLPTALVLTSLLATFNACSSTAEGVTDPAIEQAARERARRAAETEDRLFAPERMLTDLDKAIDKYTQYRMSGASPRVDSTAEKIEAYIRENVARGFDELVRQADTVDYPRNRAIAVAALGFSDRDEALAPLVNAARDENPEIVANAMFGLAMLQDPRTPPAVVERVIRAEEYEEPVRTGAAWTLHELQRVIDDDTKIVAIWRDLLDGPLDAIPAGVAVSAVRGLGLTRSTDHYELVERYASHPMALVRQAAAIALGRMGSEQAVPSLLALIGPAETNDNVRLAARKALQALAGGIDRKYDVQEWQRVFERGS